MDKRYLVNFHRYPTNGFGMDDSEDDHNETVIDLGANEFPSREQFDEFITNSKIKGQKKSQITKLYQETCEIDEALRKLSVTSSNEDKQTLLKRFLNIKTTLKSKMGLTEQTSSTKQSLRKSKGTNQK